VCWTLGRAFGEIAPIQAAPAPLPSTRTAITVLEFIACAYRALRRSAPMALRVVP
jgi:hypothetical protein